MDSIQPIIFLGLAALIISTSVLIAFSKNLVYSAFALLGTFAGMAGLFVMLSADFLAIIQLLVYIGGILVLYLFAVLMTAGISDIRLTNQSIAVKAALPALFLLVLLLGKVIYSTHWFISENPSFEPTTAEIGKALLGEYLLPFELVSILLLATLIGAVSMGRKETK